MERIPNIEPIINVIEDHRDDIDTIIDRLIVIDKAQKDIIRRLDELDTFIPVDSQ